MELFQTPQQTPGEFFDRLTIVMRKARYLPDEKDRLSYRLKHNQMVDAIPDSLPTEVCRKILELVEVNSEIWWLEADIRKGKEGQLGEAEVGRRAIAIREINGRRIQLVNEINELYGIQEKEVKADHVSQEDNEDQS